MNADIPLRDYNIRDPRIFHEMTDFFRGTFTGGTEFNGVTLLAEQIRDGLQRIDPLIQQATQNICPRCKEICCISKHGFYTYEDLIYLFALGLNPPPVSFGADDRDPCQYLRQNGCSLERWKRPSGCTWYFCDTLLDYIETQPAYRDFDEVLRDVAELWMKMVEEFGKIRK